MIFALSTQKSRAWNNDSGISRSPSEVPASPRAALSRLSRHVRRGVTPDRATGGARGRAQGRVPAAQRRDHPVHLLAAQRRGARRFRHRCGRRDDAVLPHRRPPGGVARRRAARAGRRARAQFHRGRNGGAGLSFRLARAVGAVRTAPGAARLLSEGVGARHHRPEPAAVSERVPGAGPARGVPPRLPGTRAARVAKGGGVVFGHYAAIHVAAAAAGCGGGAVGEKVPPAVAEVVAEIGLRRNRRHLHAFDAAVRVERERHVCIGIEVALLPAHDEGVVLEVLELSRQIGRARKAHDAFAVFFLDAGRAVPRILVLAVVRRQRQRWRRLRGTRRHFLRLPFHFLPVRRRFLIRIQLDPVAGRHLQVLVENAPVQRRHRRSVFGVGQNGDAQFFLRHHQHRRIKALQRAAVHDELAALVVAQRKAQSIRREIGLGGGQRGLRLADAHRRLLAPQLGQLRGADQLFAVRGFAVVEQGGHPAREVFGAGVDAHRAHGVRHGHRFHDCRPAVDLAVRGRVVSGRQHVGHAGFGAGHAHRRQDAVVNRLSPRLAVLFRDDLAGHDVQQIVVGVAVAEARRRLDVPEFRDDLVGRKFGARPPQQIPGAQSQAAAVREQVAHRHGAGHVRIVHLEARQMHGDRVVPFQLALVHQHGQCRSRKPLGVGRHLEQGLAIDGRGVAQLAHAVALGRDDFSILDDGNRHARHVEGFQRQLDVGVEIVGRDGGGSRRGDCLAGHAHRCERQRQCGGDQGTGNDHGLFLELFIDRCLRHRMVMIARLGVERPRPLRLGRILEQRRVQRHHELLPAHAHEEFRQRLAHVVTRLDGRQVEAERDLVVAAFRQREVLIELLQLRGRGLAVDVVQEVHPFERHPALAIEAGRGQFAAQPGVALFVQRGQARRGRTHGVGGNAGAVQPLVQLYLRHVFGMRVEQVFLQVVHELLGGGRLECVRVEPAAQECVERLAAGALLERAQEPGALRINQAAVRVRRRIDIGTARGQRLLGGCNGRQRRQRLFLLHLQVHLGDFRAVDFFHDAGGDVGGKTFVEPHVLPRRVGHQVAGPRVRQFMRDQVHQAFVAGDHGGREEGQARIFHAAVRERRRQHDHVVPVPPVRAIQALGRFDHFFGVGQLARCGLDTRRFGVDGRARAERAHVDFADGDRQQIRWNRLRHLELPAARAGGLGVVVGAHEHPQSGGRVDARAVGKAHGRRILHRRPRTGVDVLRLAEHERTLARHGLRRRHPLQRGGRRRGAIVHAHLLRLERQRDAQGASLLQVELVEHVRRGRPAAVRIEHLHPRDIELLGIEHQRARRFVDPVQGQFGVAGQGLAAEVGLQVQIQVAGAHLVVTGVAQRIGVGDGRSQRHQCGQHERGQGLLDLHGDLFYVGLKRGAE
uniref:Uncharacterized protein n=1 Tax=Tanacetum cinerariifolium TaxID=118510 RepID=A0A699GIB6_TANCI|nr:hypothetical protein [Tanacetum cinerariifolium]